MVTSLTLLVKVLCNKEVNLFTVKTSVDMAANLNFGVKLSLVDLIQGMITL